MSELIKPMNSQERSRWRILWKTVRDKRDDFWVYIEAVDEIKDDELYRDNFATFAQFCDCEVGFGENYVNKLCKAREVRSLIGTMVPVPKIAPKIQTERQLRELKGLSEEKLRTALDIANRLAGDGPATATILKQAKTEAKNGKPTEEPVADEEVEEEPEPVPELTPREEAASVVSQLLDLFPSDSGPLIRALDEYHDHDHGGMKLAEMQRLSHLIEQHAKDLKKLWGAWGGKK